MRDLKAKGTGTYLTGTKKVKKNRMNKQKKPLELRKLLHSSLRLAVMGFTGGLVVVGLGLLLQMLVASDLFRIELVDISGCEHLSREQVLALSDIHNGVSTFALDLELIGSKIAENPWIKQARVERIFPRQLNIQVIEQKPVAIINLDYLYYLGSTGEVFKVLGRKDDFGFPVVTGFKRAVLLADPEKGQGELLRIVALIQNLRGRTNFNLDEVSEIHYGKNGGLSLFTLNGGVKIKLGIGNYTAKLNRLERIYARLMPRLEMLEYIDLNVDKRVIVGIGQPKKGAAS